MRGLATCQYFVVHGDLLLMNKLVWQWQLGIIYDTNTIFTLGKLYSTNIKHSSNGTLCCFSKSFLYIQGETGELVQKATCQIWLLLYRGHKGQQSPWSWKLFYPNLLVLKHLRCSVNNGSDRKLSLREPAMHLEGSFEVKLMVKTN